MICGVRLRSSRLSLQFLSCLIQKALNDGGNQSGRPGVQGTLLCIPHHHTLVPPSPKAAERRATGNVQYWNFGFKNTRPPTRWHMQLPGGDFFQVAVPKSFSRCLTVEGVEDSRAGTTDSLGKMVLRYSCKGLGTFHRHDRRCRHYS